MDSRYPQRRLHGTHGKFVLGVVALSLFASTMPGPAYGEVPAEDIQKITAAAPDKATAKPASPRKLLVFTLCKGYPHSSIGHGAAALDIMGKKTGAFRTVISDDPSMFEPAKLRQFDAVCFMNTTGELFTDPALKTSFIEFVRGGKGVIGIHAATDCFYEWPEFGEMMGGYFNGHPWNEKVGIKIDDTGHPVTAAFAGKPFEIADEIYQFRAPYCRQNLHVLLSLDTSRTDMTKQAINRTDGDFAVSWVRRYGRGRVFYCSLGHREEIFWNPAVLRHYLDGIQFALGDLPGDARPSAGQPEAGWTPLFNGRDLSGWKGLVGDPKSRAAMSPSELTAAQAEADAKAKAHWKVIDGALVFDGKGDSLCTRRDDYMNFELLVDWKIEDGGDSGIYLRGSPQVQIWDPAQWPEGSGGLYNNEKHPSKPLVKADKPIGEWNTFRIKMLYDRVTVHLNDVLVVDNVVMENYWERDKPIYPWGQIELQSHNTPLGFRNIWIRELKPYYGAGWSTGWENLFNGRDLTGWTAKDGSWVVEDGVLTRVGGGDIWTKETFGDFVMTLEFKLADQTNSGIFFRTGDINDCVQTGIEMQVLDSHGKSQPGKHDCGAIYDCLEPKVNAVKPPGEWNKVMLLCDGQKIVASLNGEMVIDMDLDRWTEAHKNPDGTPNKFRTAYKDMPRTGHIGFQDHGKPVWYRNIRIKRLD